MPVPITRRTMLAATATAFASSTVALSTEKTDEAERTRSLTGEIGLTTGSFMRHYTVERQPGKLRLLDLPQSMRDELDMRVLDLMTYTMASLTPRYVEQLRKRSEEAGCIITNLKMNQRELEIASPDESKRQQALAEYKRTIDIAQALGCRWVRPFPGTTRANDKTLKASYRELIDYAQPKGISLLLENTRWLTDDPDAIPDVLKLVGPGLAACPDTGNWTDQARYAGLAKAFPHAVTCDFKAFQFEPDGSHPKYDIERCFRIAWDAGFRGPWCLEHFNETLPGTLAGMRRLRDMIKNWTAAADGG